jgi:hypothetical protein
MTSHPVTAAAPAHAARRVRFPRIPGKSLEKANTITERNAAAAGNPLSSGTRR